MRPALVAYWSETFVFVPIRPRCIDASNSSKFGAPHKPGIKLSGSVIGSKSFVLSSVGWQGGIQNWGCAFSHFGNKIRPDGAFARERPRFSL
jgi:hypothetical protein